MKMARKSPRKSLYNRNAVMEMENFNDDDDERQNSRNMVEALRKRNSVSGTPTLNQSNESDVRSHIQTCIKLYNDNKINSKNVWEIKIINYIQLLINKEDILSIACSTLDIATKVYALRVDDLHTQALQLAADLNRLVSKSSNREDDDNDDQPDAANDAECGAERQKPKRKKKIKILSATEKHTIAKDPTKLLAPIPKLSTTTFSYKNNSFSTSNLLSSKLHIDYSNLDFKILSNDRYWKRDNSEDYSLSEEKYSFPLSPINGSICKAFNHFQIDQWNPDQEKINATQLDEVLYDADGVPLHQLDGSMHDIFQEGSDNIEEEVAEVDDVDLPELLPDAETNNDVENDYNYCSLLNNTNIVRINRLWAGPSHWKFKYVKPAVSRFSGATNNAVEVQHKAKKKKQLVQVPIDFSNIEICHEKLPAKRARAPNYTLNKFTLPLKKVGQICPYKMFASKNMPIPKETHPVEDNDCRVEPYNYDNMNDSQYCPNGNDDHFDDNGVGDDFDQAVEDGIGNHLIDAPDTVEEMYIPYAKKAKQINVKKLKAKIWSTLTNDTDKVQETTFTKFYKNFLNRLDADTKSKICVPTTLVSLLYLTAEHNLSLVQSGNLEDFKIASE